MLQCLFVKADGFLSKTHISNPHIDPIELRVLLTQLFQFLDLVVTFVFEAKQTQKQRIHVFFVDLQTFPAIVLDFLSQLEMIRNKSQVFE